MSSWVSLDGTAWLPLLCQVGWLGLLMEYLEVEVPIDRIENNGQDEGWAIHGLDGGPIDGASLVVALARTLVKWRGEEPAAPGERPPLPSFGGR